MGVGSKSGMGRGVLLFERGWLTSLSIWGFGSSFKLREKESNFRIKASILSRVWFQTRKRGKGFTICIGCWTYVSIWVWGPVQELGFKSNLELGFKV